MKTHKLVNDPVYGFVEVPYGLLMSLVEHPYFQRLRRIKQLSLTHYVYPGALHTRFNHALGALHLMTRTLQVLRSKGVDISDEEFLATQAAILLHDIGHGPFSHTLEHTLIQVHHEYLSLLFMERLNAEFGGALDLTIQIFKGQYHKPFLCELVSSQLDMDRMDYLNRDSFFTGVSEGVIGYHRLIKMLNVLDGRLVVEEKGIYSIEKFLTARRIMYWQVYLHKTVLSAELMLIQALQRAKDSVSRGEEVPATSALAYFLKHQHLAQSDFKDHPELLDTFARLDDIDIAAAMKEWQYHDDPALRWLTYSLTQRKLFRLEYRTSPFAEAEVLRIREMLQERSDIPAEALPYCLLQGQESNAAYTTMKNEILILGKDGHTRPMSALSEFTLQGEFTKYYLCYPK